MQYASYFTDNKLLNLKIIISRGWDISELLSRVKFDPLPSRPQCMIMEMSLNWLIPAIKYTLIYLRNRLKCYLNVKMDSVLSYFF